MTENPDNPTLARLTQTLKNWFGLRNDIKSNVQLVLPTEPEETTVSVGPYVKTEFEIPCPECGEDNQYFHQHYDSTECIIGMERRLRCRDCYLEKHGEKSEIPVPLKSGETPTHTAIYPTIDPREVFEGDS